jgi:hypothetical protein
MTHLPTARPHGEELHGAAGCVGRRAKRGAAQAPRYQRPADELSVWQAVTRWCKRSAWRRCNPARSLACHRDRPVLVHYLPLAVAPLEDAGTTGPTCRTDPGWSSDRDGAKAAAGAPSSGHCRGGSCHAQTHRHPARRGTGHRGRSRAGAVPQTIDVLAGPWPVAQLEQPADGICHELGGAASSWTRAQTSRSGDGDPRLDLARRTPSAAGAGHKAANAAAACLPGAAAAARRPPRRRAWRRIAPWAARSATCLTVVLTVPPPRCFPPCS